MGNTYRNPKYANSLKSKKGYKQKKIQNSRDREGSDPWNTEELTSHENRIPVNAAARMLKKEMKDDEIIKRLMRKFNISREDAHDGLESAKYKIKNG